MKNQNKHVVIIGAGTAGVILANKLSRKTEHNVTVIDKADKHYYQPGFLFMPFGHYDLESLSKPTDKLINKKVQRIKENVTSIDFNNNKLKTENDQYIEYDVLVIATGTHIDPATTEGLVGDKWYKNIFDFYTPEGAMGLRDALSNFQGGNIAVQIMDMPIKCPVAPIEFTFLLDEYLKKRDIRDKVNIKYVTSLSGAFTKPVASDKLSHYMSDKGVEIVADFFVEKVDQENNRLICYDEREVKYDLLVTVPINVGAKFLHGSEIVNDLGFVKVNHNSLQSENYLNVFAVGDAADLPTSKAGSVAHFEVETLLKNINKYANGEELEQTFDGHANCFVEFGDKKALLLDFNYETEPLEGKFPFAVLGPMKLLNPSRLNHIGKLAFRYIYWMMLLPGRSIPFIPAQMSKKGKKIVN